MQKDISLKQLQAYNDVFAETFNVLVCGGMKIVDEDSLQSFPTKAVSRTMNHQLHEGSRDVCKADKNGNYYRLIFDLENQTDYDNTMPERIMGYDFSAYEEQIRLLREQDRRKKRKAFTKRIHDGKKLAPVVTAVVHWGSREEWAGPRRLHDMLDFPAGSEDTIRPLVPDYPINLIHMADLSEETRSHLHTDMRLLADYMACRDDPVRLEQLMKNREHKIIHREEFLTALSAISGHKQYQALAEKLAEKQDEEEYADKEAITMYNIAAELENRGIQKGIQTGIQRGIQTGIQRGIQTGICALVEFCREQGFSRESTTAAITEKFSLSLEEADHCTDLYWGA